MEWERKCIAYLSAVTDILCTPHEALFKWCGLESRSLDKAGLDAIRRDARGIEIPPFLHDWSTDAAYLTHPVTGSVNPYPLTPGNVLPPGWKERAADQLRQVVEKMAASCGGDAEKLFWLLWRCLSDRLAKADGEDRKDHFPGGLWRLLPAHPGAPCHTVWQHASIRSAIAGATANLDGSKSRPALLLFTIGSVEDMITTARRSQDAWAGSFLLSYLSWWAVRSIISTCGPDAVIFPALKEQPWVDDWLLKEEKLRGAFKEYLSNPPAEALEVGNIPNLVTAIVPQAMARELADAATKAMNAAWCEVSKEVRAAIGMTFEKSKWNVSLRSMNDDAIWNRQMKDFPESRGIYWVACPWGDSAGEVIEAWKRWVDSGLPDDFTLAGSDGGLVELLMKQANESLNIGMAYPLLSAFSRRALKARKSLRDFHPVREPNEKCSLCGVREAWHPAFEDLYHVKEIAIRDEKLRSDPSRKPGVWLKEFWQAFGRLDRPKKGYLKLAGRIRRGEKLCSVCLTRRLALDAHFKHTFGLDSHLFPSTAGIASMPFRSELLDAVMEDISGKLATALERFCKKARKFLDDHKSFYQAAIPSYLEERVRDLPWNHWIREDFLQLDGSWLYPDAFDSVDEFCREAGLPSPDESSRTAMEAAMSDLKEQLRALHDEIGKYETAHSCKFTALSTYYAVLNVDGDKMGDWLTGAIGPSFVSVLHPGIPEELKRAIPQSMRRPVGPAVQLALSECLKDFTLRRAREIVERENLGKLVYAGGDDLLAFLPVSRLLCCIDRLYREFAGEQGWHVPESAKREEPRSGAAELFRLPGGRSKEKHHAGPASKGQGVTLSMGAVVARHSKPLADVLRQSHQVLKKGAKDQIGRNAFAIRVLKGSGEVVDTGFRFEVTDYGGEQAMRDKELVMPLLIAVQDLIPERLSSRIGQSVSVQAWARAKNDDYLSSGSNPVQFPKKDPLHHSDLKGALDEPRHTELIRLVKQHTKVDKDRAPREAIEKLFSVLSQEIRSEYGAKDKLIPHDPWKKLADLLLMLRFLKGQED